jgi:Xanthine/uracil permeases
MKYNVDDKLGTKDLILYGLQWFSVILPTLIIISGVTSALHTDSLSLQLFYSQKIFIIAGITLIIQILFGHKLPVLSGPASVLLIGILGSHNASLEAIYTAIAIGGLFVASLSYGKFFHFLQQVFTTRVVIVILLLVALTMQPLIIRLSVGTNGETCINFVFSVTLALLMVYANHILKGVYKSLVVVTGLIAGSLFYLLMTGIPSLPEVNLIDPAVWKGHLFIQPEFDFSTILAFFFCFLALTVNEFGAIQATGRLIKADNPDQRSKKGLRITGFSNVFSGLFGVVGIVDYSMSPGIISATRCASRFPLIITGVILILCACIPQSLLFFSYIPQVVMGSILLYVMAAQLSSGLQLMITEKAIFNFESAITISIPIMIGTSISFAPEAFIESIPALVRPLLGNGFVMGTIIVLILEHTLNRSIHSV